MVEVLHVEGLGDEVVPFFSVDPGETLGDVIGRLGGTARIETVPERPPAFSDEARRFIAGYQREDADSVLAVFWRYGSLDAEEFDTVDEAVRFLESGEDYGSLSSEAVIDGDRLITDPELRDLRWAVSVLNSSNS